MLRYRTIELLVLILPDISHIFEPEVAHAQLRSVKGRSGCGVKKEEKVAAAARGE